MIINRGGPLTESDYRSLEARWITPEVAQAAGLRRVDDREGREVLGRHDSGSYSGILIPYFWPEAQYPTTYRIRRDHPEMESGKPKGKYLSPPTDGNHLYFPPGTPACWLNNTAVSIVIVEGEFKSLALSRLMREGRSDAAEEPKFLPVAIPGVWSWKDKRSKVIDPSGVRVSNSNPIPDLDRIVWTGRRVTVLYDKNVDDKGEIQAARWGLTRILRDRGAEVLWATWPKTMEVAA